MKKVNEIKNYPIVDGHRRHYLHHPVFNETTFKWEAVDVYIDGPGGHSVLGNPARTGFATEEDCQKGCDIHNNYHGWSKPEVNDIISLSMQIK